MSVRILPRRSKQGTDLARRVTHPERDIGRRATYHVYYRGAGGRIFCQPSWCDTADAAAAALERVARQHGIACQIIGVMELDDVPLDEPAAEASGDAR